ncbi:MAG: DUF2490 domain-containing protein [Myxococcota bacterium]|nr:DUF2490 domain-containing protein [Myxococcota bacterium]
MRLLVLVLTAGIAEPASADDLQLWAELGAKRKLSTRFAVTFDQHLRFDEDISRVSAVMPEAAVHVEARMFRASAGYRLEYERDRSGDLVIRHRFHAALRTRLELEPVRIDHRLQLQEQLRPASMDELRHTVRNRIEVSYRGFKRWSLAGSAEVFHDLDNGDAIHLDKSWLSVGGGYRKSGRDTDVFYRLELPHHDARSPIVHIFGAAIHLDL